MPSLRQLSPALSLLTYLAAAPAFAGTTTPTLPLGTPGPANLYGLELNQWYAFANQVSAGTEIDGHLVQDGGSLIMPTGADLSRKAEASQVIGSRSSAAFARVAPASIGANAYTLDSMDPFSTGHVAIGYSSVAYVAVLDQNTTFNFTLKLDGALRTTGDTSLGVDQSGAAVAALAYGSQREMTNASQAAVWAAAGVDPYADEPVLIHQLSTLSSSTQTYLDAFGAQSDSSHRWIDVDTTLHVSAEGTRINCDAWVTSPACGRYFYLVSLVLFTGAQNGGMADFSHSLSVNGYTVGGGTSQPFNAISAVPEPATALLLALGLLAVGGRAARRRPA